MPADRQEHRAVPWAQAGEKVGETLAWETRIQLCGRLSVERQGMRVESRLPGRQGARLLAYLVVHADRWVTRDELITAVWGDTPPPDGDPALASLLSKVRRVVGADMIQGRSPLHFMPSDATLIDVAYARDALHRAEAQLSRGDPRGAWQPSQTAYSIAVRPFLLGHDADWVDDVRRELAEIAIRGLECHGLVLLATEPSGTSWTERVARRLVEQAPYRESAYCLLMRALERAGNVAEALRVFDRVRSVLADELGAAPGPEAAALHAHLLHVSV